MPAALIGQNKPDEEIKVVEAETAFLVFIEEDGTPKISLDINAPVTAKETATIPQVKRALSELLDDISTQEMAARIASGILQAQMQMAHQMQQQQEAQAALAQMGDLRR
jgi:hypothetical protein